MELGWRKPGLAESPRPAAPPACFPAAATLQRPQRAGACTGHRPLLWPAPPSSGVGLSFQGARQADGILSTGSTWPRHLVGLVLANSVLRHWSLAFAQLSCPHWWKGWRWPCSRALPSPAGSQQSAHACRALRCWTGWEAQPRVLLPPWASSAFCVFSGPCGAFGWGETQGRVRAAGPALGGGRAPTQPRPRLS